MFQNIFTNISDFHTNFLVTTLGAIKTNSFEDNFDYKRFAKDANTKPKSFNTFSCSQNLHWYFHNIDNIFKAYSSLTNEYSKNLYLDILAYRIGGHLSVKIPTKWKDFSEQSNFDQIMYSTASKFNSKFDGIKHYDFDFEGFRYICDTFSFRNILERGQYFYKDDKLSIKPSRGDVVLDCGACTGESAIVFGNAVGNKGQVFAFDPVADHLEIVRHNIEQNPDLQIKAIPYGLSDRSVEAEPIRLEKVNPGFNSNGREVPTKTIDDFVEELSLGRVDFIKMDIEGSELASLKGALATIRSFKPKLAISIYHHFDDYFSIINYLSSLRIYENLVLGHYTIHREETVLYCS